MIYFVTTCTKDYAKPWIFPTLSKLTSHKVWCLLEPGDDRELPANCGVYRYNPKDYVYQDGRFLDAMFGLNADDVVVLVDADAVFQRGLNSKEMSVLETVGNSIAMGYNLKPNQRGADEYNLLRPKKSIAEVAKLSGLSADALFNAPIYNTGFIASTLAAWNRLRRITGPVLDRPGLKECFGIWSWPQYLICALLYQHDIPITPLDYTWHSHGHFGLQPGHGNVGGKLYYNDNLVLYAHAIPWVTDKSVELVVSHYADKLDWLKAIEGKVGIRVYSKNPSACPRLPVGPTGLPNVGVNIHTFLHHIASRYDDLADWTVFTQDNPFPHMPGLGIGHLLQPQVTAVAPWLFHGREWDDSGRLVWDKWGHTSQGEFGPRWREQYESGEIPKCGMDILTWCRRWADVDLGDQACYHPGAIYGVPREALRSRPQEFYARLAKYFENLGAVKSEEAHYLERAFPWMFTDKIGDLARSTTVTKQRKDDSDGKRAETATETATPATAGAA